MLFRVFSVFEIGLLFSNLETSCRLLVEFIQIFRPKNSKYWFCQFLSLFVQVISLLTLFRVFSVFGIQRSRRARDTNSFDSLTQRPRKDPQLALSGFSDQKTQKSGFVSFHHYLFRRSRQRLYFEFLVFLEYRDHDGPMIGTPLILVLRDLVSTFSWHYSNFQTKIFKKPVLCVCIIICLGDLVSVVISSFQCFWNIEITIKA